MPARIARGGVPALDIVLAIVLLLAAAAGILAVAARIYRASILHSGTRVSLRVRGGGSPERRAKARPRDLSGWKAASEVGRGSGDDLDPVRLRALGALDDVELHALVLVERAVAVGLDGGVVDEHVLPAVHGDEAVALLVVEPLHGALCHVHSLLGAIPNRTPRGLGVSFLGPAYFRARSWPGSWLFRLRKRLSLRPGRTIPGCSGPKPRPGSRLAYRCRKPRVRSPTVRSSRPRSTDQVRSVVRMSLR